MTFLSQYSDGYLLTFAVFGGVVRLRIGVSAFGLLLNSGHAVRKACKGVLPFMPRPLVRPVEHRQVRRRTIGGVFYRSDPARQSVAVEQGGELASVALSLRRREPDKCRVAQSRRSRHAWKL